MNDNFPLVTIPNSELRFLKSRLLGKEYKIQVALPTDYAESKETYPVLYVLDADLYFGTIAETTRDLAAGRKMFSIEVPDMIVVGVGYPIETTRSCYTNWDMAKPSEYAPALKTLRRLRTLRWRDGLPAEPATLWPSSGMTLNP